MDNMRPKKENPTTYKYMKILKSFLYPAGGWPGEVLGEEVSCIVRYHRYHLPVQSIVAFLGQVFYLIKYWNKNNVILRGHCFINICLCLVTIIFDKVDTVSYYFTLYLMSMMVASMVLFNVSPCYINYINGAFSGKLIENTTLEFSVYYTYPGFDPVEKFTFVTIFNFYLSYSCATSVCSIDLLLSVMVFQIIGHIQILRHNLTVFPKPVKHNVHNGTMPVEMYDAEENQMIHEKLVECIEYHKMIVCFTEDLSAFFGPLLGINYVFHLVGCCLLLLECSQGTDAIVRFGPLTFAIFGQLIQVSVTFEIVGTVSEKLKDSVYDTPWESMNTKNRRIVCIFLSRVQTPIHVTAMGVTTVGVTTMASILRTTFSYFAFLQSMEK